MSNIKNLFRPQLDTKKTIIPGLRMRNIRCLDSYRIRIVIEKTMKLRCRAFDHLIDSSNKTKLLTNMDLGNLKIVQPKNRVNCLGLDNSAISKKNNIFILLNCTYNHIVIYIERFLLKLYYKTIESLNNFIEMVAQLLGFTKFNVYDISKHWLDLYRVWVCISHRKLIKYRKGIRMRKFIQTSLQCQGIYLYLCDAKGKLGAKNV